MDKVMFHTYSRSSCRGLPNQSFFPYTTKNIKILTELLRGAAPTSLTTAKTSTYKVLRRPHDYVRVLTNDARLEDSRYG